MNKLVRYHMITAILVGPLLASLFRWGDGGSLEDGVALILSMIAFNTFLILGELRSYMDVRTGWLKMQLLGEGNDR